MEKIKTFIKSTRLLSRILIAIWFFMCAFCTIDFFEESISKNIISDIISLFYIYMFCSAMFLIPAITITQSQQAVVNKENIQYSEKSYGITLLLSIFLGFLGIHRFYVGKKVTGVIYLLTFGGFTIGWIIDIILVVIGRFPDKKRHIIRFPFRSRKQPDVRNNLLKEYETIKNTESDRKGQTGQVRKQIENESEETSLFSDVVVSGEPEKKQQIPDRSVIENEKKLSVQPSLIVSTSAEESEQTDSADSTGLYFSDTSKNKFLNDMKKYANTVGKIAEFVPFVQYWPTYDNMNNRQRAWYFYWRTQIRNGKYPNTDMSYIFVHVYELLSGCGWEEASDGYTQLISLWMAYRDRFPKLDNYLFEWIFDFTQLHHLDFVMPEIDDLRLPRQLVMEDILIDKHSNQKPLKLPFPLICSLCDYSITGSKFYKDGNQLLIQEAIPRVIALADAILLKEKGRGILAIYGPNRTRKQNLYIFQGAVCPNANKRVDISVKAYTASTKLRDYINQLVRYSENILRSLYGYRGRLRGVEIEPELSNLVKNFLEREYAPKEQTISIPTENIEIKLNFDRIEALREQSDAVRDALEVPDEVVEQKEKLTELPEVSEMFLELSQSAKQFLNSLRLSKWESPVVEEKRVLVDEINSVANRFIVRSLVVIENGCYIVEDDYRDELDYIYENVSETEIVMRNEVGNNKEIAVSLDEYDLSEELKQFIGSLTEVQKQVLNAILFLDNSQEKLEQLAEESMSMPEILIDEINDVATQFLDDILIDTFGDEPKVLEQYAEELKSIIQLEVK